jgi:predicted GNAT superfamily acetyltransferase
MTIEIRSIQSPEDVCKLETLQKLAWDMPDIEVIPARTMHAIQYNGGLLLGAYDGDELVGFVFGVLGTVRGLHNRIDQVAAARLQLYSTILGVLPEYHDRGVAYQLKVAQREFALRLGIRLVTWTYDPLESRNGWLNIGKLGAVCHNYIRDYHGELGGINAGLTTDRFYVEWWVTGNRVRGRVGRQRRPLSYDQLIAGRAILINEAEYDERGLLLPPGSFAESEANIVLVEIPSEIQAIKQADMELARSWRAHTRALFEHYFAHQFIVTDFARRQDEAGRERSYYVLTYQHA